MYNPNRYRALRSNNSTTTNREGEKLTNEQKNFIDVSFDG